MSGCLYGFGGGTGFPPSVKTVAVLPFDNLTAEPTLTSEINRAVREAVQNRLGLRPSGEALADALVKGSIQRYEPDVVLAYAGNDQTQNVQVSRRKVQITINVQIFDQKNNKILWERNGLMVEGDYTSSEIEGRKKAIEKLITDIVDGAQSQW